MTANAVLTTPITTLETSLTVFAVIAVKPNGKRVVCGSCPTRAAAESWAELLRQFASAIGGDAFVEKIA